MLLPRLVRIIATSTKAGLTTVATQLRNHQRHARAQRPQVGADVEFTGSDMPVAPRAPIQARRPSRQRHLRRRPNPHQLAHNGPAMVAQARQVLLYGWVAPHGGIHRRGEESRRGLINGE